MTGGVVGCRNARGLWITHPFGGPWQIPILAPMRAVYAVGPRCAKGPEGPLVCYLP